MVLALVPLTRRDVLLTGVAGLTALAVPRPSPPTPGLLVVGDSWAAGLYADPSRALGQVAGAALGWPVQVDAVSGTGYATAVGDGGTYLERLTVTPPDDRPGIAVLQGGSNDRRVALDDLTAAVTDVLAALAAARPGMRPLLLGPGPDPEPVDDAQRAVDGAIGAAALASGVPYVSMLAEDWVPATWSDTVIDPMNHHPTPSGQRYLGGRLAEAVRRIYPAGL